MKLNIGPGVYGCDIVEVVREGLVRVSGFNCARQEEWSLELIYAPFALVVNWQGANL
jgi:hypothetical protein